MEGLEWGRLLFLNLNPNFGLNGNNNLNNNGRFVGIDLLEIAGTLLTMDDSTISLFDELCHYDNLVWAYEKARKGKTQQKYVLDFEAKLKENLHQLQQELQNQTYYPQPLKTFILRDPKTRTISKSEFRDRVIHHALCNIIEPILERNFIHDSYANRLGKGTLKAVERFDEFKRKSSKNNTQSCFVLKADIKHYFETVDHAVLFAILSTKINDEKVLWLIKIILSNHYTTAPGKGMPLGNLTSQFFANVYLNELDQFVKHTLKAEYYIRYVDDFVILYHQKEILENYKQRIDIFLRKKLALELHPHKSKIITLEQGVHFLGFRIFYHHKLIRRKNIRKSHHKFKQLEGWYKEGLLDREKVIEYLEGWLAFVSHANTYKYRRRLLQWFNQAFPLDQKTPITVLQKHKNHSEKIESSHVQFTAQKTAQLFTKGISIPEIAQKRQIKESTVWTHLANLIEHNQLSVWKILPKDKIVCIKQAIMSEKETLKVIKSRIKDNAITYDEIACVIADLKRKNKKMNIVQIVSWFQRTNCYRKCYLNPVQRKICSTKFNQLCSSNATLNLNKREFTSLFNNHLKICVLPEAEKRRYIPWNEFMASVKRNRT